MKYRARTLTALAVILPLMVSTQVLADPEGLWNTEDKEAQVRLEDCGDKLCGHITWLKDPLDDAGNPLTDSGNPEKDLQNRPIVGLKIVWDMEPKGNGKTWEDGKVYDPESGKTYNARITLKNEKTLDLRGYVGTPMFGSTSTWTRAEQDRSE